MIAPARDTQQAAMEVLLICRRLHITVDEYYIGQRWFYLPALWQQGRVVINYQPKINQQVCHERT